MFEVSTGYFEFNEQSQFVVVATTLFHDHGV